MKRIYITAAFVIGMGLTGMAQTTGSNSSNSTSVSSSADTQKDSKNTKKGKTAQAAGAQPDSLNDRKMYNWKDGQRATPTGHEATGTGSGFSAINKDSAIAPRDTTQQKQ